MAEKKATIEAIGLKQIAVGDLFANPHNPRVLFDRVPLKELQESIKRNGILVPLTVYLDPHKQRWIILDGQRRWICAQEVGLKMVPVNQVAAPSLVENIVTMFQIHKLRQDWELMPTALKVELLMDETKDRSESRLAALTGLDESVIIRCKKLISYDRRFQDMMLVTDPDQRIKADFFIELYPVINDRDIKEFEWFQKNKFIDQMLSKYLGEDKTIKAVTDFRLVKQYTTAARRIRVLTRYSKRLREFAEIQKTPISHLEIQEATTHAEAVKLTRKVGAIQELIDAVDIEEFYGEEDLWTAVESLVNSLESALKKPTSDANEETSPAEHGDRHP
jgi:ParB family chromosome partitioning protein